MAGLRRVGESLHALGVVSLGGREPTAPAAFVPRGKEEPAVVAAGGVAHLIRALQAIKPLHSHVVGQLSQAAFQVVPSEGLGIPRRSAPALRVEGDIGNSSYSLPSKNSAGLICLYASGVPLGYSSRSRSASSGISTGRYSRRLRCSRLISEQKSSMGPTYES